MEILVRVVDKHPVESPDYEASSQRGDVIVVCPNGHPWSPAELTNPDWRIIRAPILQAEADALLAKSQDVTVKRRREWKIDLDALPNSEKFSGQRADEIVVMARKQVTDSAVKKQ
jgi:hypothetical protein